MLNLLKNINVCSHKIFDCGELHVNLDMTGHLLKYSY